MGFVAAQFSSTNFTFTIAVPGHENISFQCQQLSGLGLTPGTVEHSHHGLTRKYPGDSIIVNPVSLTIILDDKLLALEQILDHIYTIRNPVTSEGDPEATFTGIIQLYDSMNYPTMKLTLHEAWFENMGDINLNSSDSDNTNITIDVTCAFNNFSYERIEQD